jgi:CMP-N-acetylneuraminic acid synthetase
MFADSVPDRDSLFSVTRRQARFWTADGKAVNHDPARLLRTQDLSPLLEENSCLYLFSRAGLLRYGNRIGERPLMFEMDPREAWDIDEESDFEIAELLFRHREEAAGR